MCCARGTSRAYRLETRRLNPPHAAHSPFAVNDSNTSSARAGRTPSVRTLRGVALLGYGGVFVLLLLRYGWLAPPTQVSPWLPLVITTLPLVLPLRGLLRGHRYTYQWSGFLALAYFIFAVDSLFSDGWSQLLGVGEALASLTWFFAAGLYARNTKGS